MLKVLGALASALALTGCAASVDYKPASLDANAAQVGSEKGIRYYENSPYLLVYSNGHGGLVWQVLYLPDQTKLMVASPVVYGGHTEMTMYFHNGVLAGSSSVGDTTQVPKAIISAVQSALPLLAAAALDTATEKKFPAPYLYKIVVTGTAVKFYGGVGQGDGIIVPINAGAGS